LRLALTLSAENLSCQRGERLLFEGLSFTLAAGQLVQVVGPNGSGKSSLLNILTGLGRLEAGRVCWQGADIRSPDSEYRQSVAWLGHQLGIKSALSPHDNLGFYARLFSVQVDIDALLHKVGLLDFADMPCHSLSAGQNRRTALARLLLEQRAVWILDEPYSGLDSEGQALLSLLISEHVSSGGSCIMTAHHSLDIPNVTVMPLQLGAFR
jgi:heme exporter protein A